MRTEDERFGDINLIQYFWEEKGDLERWVHWHNLKHEYPEVERAWDEYKRAKRLLDLEIKAL